MMTPREGCKLCIRMAGYGIRQDVVAAIQEDARSELIQKIHDLQKLVIDIETKSVNVTT